MLEPSYIIKFGEPLPEEAFAEKDDLALNVSEFFYGTIQGEGPSIGVPAAFLRLAGCPVNCEFCDTAEVWRTAKRVKISWLIKQMKETGLAKMLDNRDQIFVITGGSPLLQQKMLAEFFKVYETLFQRLPWVEVENECSIKPDLEFARYVSGWNNSPKLSNSGVPEERRYNPEAMLELLDYPCVYKFVVKDEADWQEIEEKYIKPGYVRKHSILLMPMGATQQEYFENREKVVELAVKHGVRYSPREHIAIWDKKTGI